MKIITILITGLIAGTLDILAAIFVLAGGNAVGVFKYIASGAFGKAAFDGGNEMVVWGAVFHYLIAMFWTGLFFLLYPQLSFLKRNKWLNAVVYGIIVWSVMNLLILPFTKIAPQIFTVSGVLKNIVILIICIGLPAALSADRFYKNER
ncbi:MAG: hypothetical protein LUM44_14795 [Pyrinomonadaceae bacterium]|nr:hypothetical protein [Pyrinomonadaceae bacterium]